MKKRIAIIFPGQGAQKVGMGKDLFESFSVARECFQEADEILGRKLSDIAFQGPGETLTATHNSQVALYVHSMAIWRVIQEQLPELLPFAAAGLSLGEYTALSASGKLAFEHCLSLVQARGHYMSDACESQKGGMAVVMGMEGPEVEALVQPIEGLWAANFNCPGQVVISGTEAGLTKGSEVLKAAGAKRVLPLNVHGAFHSGLMQEAQDRLKPQILEAPLKENDVLLAMNVPGDIVKDSDQIRQNLILQVTHPVRWEAGIRKLMDAGVEIFVELGAGSTLAGMNKRIGVPVPTINVETTEDLEKLAEGVAC